MPSKKDAWELQSDTRSPDEELLTSDIKKPDADSTTATEKQRSANNGESRQSIAGQEEDGANRKAELEIEKSEPLLRAVTSEGGSEDHSIPGSAGLTKQERAGGCDRDRDED